MIYDYDDLLIENEIAFLEAYQGKSNSLKKIESQVGKARQKYIGNGTIVAGIYNDREFVVLGDMLADEFGFKYVDFNLVNDSHPNAMTVLAGSSVTANLSYDTYKLDSSKHKFKKRQLSTIIRVTTGMWCNSEFTDAEVTAIILHEIGHNFQHTVNNSLRMYGTFLYALNFTTAIIQAASGAGIPSAIINFVNGDSEARANVNKYIKGDPTLSSLMNSGSQFVGIIRRIFGEAFAMIDTITMGTIKGGLGLASMLNTNPVDAIVNIATAPIGKGAEYVSDNFASELGYGPELISALYKIELDPNTAGTTVEAIAKKLPLFNNICTVFSLPSVLFASLFSKHPMTPKRAVNAVRDLEDEVKKSNLTPKMKKEIQIQIDEMKHTVDKYTKVDSAFDGLALKKSLFKTFANYNRDPKGTFTRSFTVKDMQESAYDDFIMENDLYFIDIDDLI